MTKENVENDWFTASFPGPVEVAQEPDNPPATVTEWATEIDPFGVFAIRVTNMAIDPFVAVGAIKWVSDFGDSLVSGFDEYRPELLEDTVRDPAPGLKVRDLVFRFDYEGPCGCFGRVMAITDGAFGRVLVASAAVGWTPDWEKAAFEFLDSIRLAVSEPAWQPES